jgi:Uma2 family endonuclease
MTQVAQVEPRYTAERYLELVQAGVLGPEDRVELLEGVIVAMVPQNPRHAAAIGRVDDALRDAIGKRAVVRVQSPFVAGGYSVPEPDVVVAPGKRPDYDDTHPSRALLVVEVADTSLMQDRLTKAGIYAAADVPEYWLVNLRDDCVEVFRAPEPAASRYADTFVAHRGERLNVGALSGASVAVDDLLPGRAPA